MFRGSKGHDHLLDAFSRVRARRPDARSCSSATASAGSGRRRLARERGLREAVVFTGFRDDVPALLAAMDCFVLASTRTEGVPQSLLQAFAAGMPVVASRIGGIPEVVEDGVTGLLVSPEDPAALAAAHRADARGSRRRRRRAAGRPRARRGALLAFAASISRLLALYDELLAARRR